MSYSLYIILKYKYFLNSICSSEYFISQLYSFCVYFFLLSKTSHIIKIELVSNNFASLDTLFTSFRQNNKIFFLLNLTLLLFQVEKYCNSNDRYNSHSNYGFTGVEPAFGGFWDFVVDGDDVLGQSFVFGSRSHFFKYSLELFLYVINLLLITLIR